MTVNAINPSGVIGESDRIDGISAAECHLIFPGWALSLKGEGETLARLEALLRHYGPDHPGHPMTAVLSEGLAERPEAARRGGRAARLRQAIRRR